MTEVSLAEHNNVVKAFPSDRTDQLLVRLSLRQGQLILALLVCGLQAVCNSR